MRAFLLAVVGAIFFPAVLVGQDSAKNSAAGRQGKPADKAPALQINRSGLSALIDSLEKDTTATELTVRLTTDSVGVSEAAGKSDSNRYRKLLDNPLLPMAAPPRDGLIAFRERARKDFLFYLVTGILLLLAVIRIGFPSYFSRLFQYFFQTSMRQRQTRDRLLQEQLAAVGLNLLFFMIMGTFVTLLAFWRGWYVGSFWMLWSASTGFLSLIYGAKYIFLQLTGWVFNSSEAMRSYIFVVYLVNKIMAILFLPLLVLVAFSAPPIVESSLTIGLLLVGAAFVYRYAVSFPIIRNKMALNAFHFFLYFISLEVIPLLVILKLLFRKLNVFV
jgi:hypothetical protein